MTANAQLKYKSLLEADRVQSMRHLVEAINAALEDVENVDFFTTVVAEAVRNGHVRQADIARRFCIDRSGVARWIAGTHAPRHYARPVILNWLRDEVELQMRELEGERRVAPRGQALSRRPGGMQPG